jgi:hypothetical protein
MYRYLVLSILMLAGGASILMAPQCAHAQRLPTQVTEVSPPGSTPYATTFFITLTSGSGANGFSPDAVPADKRLVIEFVSISVLLADPSEGPPIFALQDSINGTHHNYLLDLKPVASGSGEYRTTQMVKLYHDGNGVNGPGAQCSRRQNSWMRMECTITISGYLINK